MTDWLAPVRSALDARTSPAAVFFRDDDVGWDDERLGQLLDCFDAAELPLDLAVIPAALTDSLAAALAGRLSQAPRLGIHQHGWAHINHETEGRKSEFGAARPPSALREDLERGRRVLQAAFGRSLDPAFTPPWNRCGLGLGAVLLELGFTVLSRDATAPPFGLTGLCECPISVDWSARRKGVPQTLGEIAESLANALGSDRPAGVLFHHAVMDVSALAAARQLLAMLSRHPMVRSVSLMEAAAQISATEIRPMESVR